MGTHPQPGTQLLAESPTRAFQGSSVSPSTAPELILYAAYLLNSPLSLPAPRRETSGKEVYLWTTEFSRVKEKQMTPALSGELGCPPRR